MGSERGEEEGGFKFLICDFGRLDLMGPKGKATRSAHARWPTQPRAPRSHHAQKIKTGACWGPGG